MHSTQQRFWPDAQPLVERLGRDFFLQLPECPGVYLMKGAADAVLYVGKAKNLRRRLNWYRVANPERMPRRILRLVRRVEQISIEECADERAALNRESFLLRELKPKFNRAGVWKGSEWFIVWRHGADGLELAATKAPEEGWESGGAMGSSAVYLHRALVRLLWSRMQPERGLTGIPAGWFKGEHGGQTMIPQYENQITSAAAEKLNALFTGEFTLFQSWLTLPTHPFERLSFVEDLTLVAEYFGKKVEIGEINLPG